MPRNQNKRVIVSNTFLPLLLLLFFVRIESFSVLHSQQTGRERRLKRELNDYSPRRANKESTHEEINECTTKHVLRKYCLLPSQQKSRPMSPVDWIMIGTKPIIESKTPQWEAKAKEDGGDVDRGKLFDFGKSSYNEIQEMIVSREGYVPKSISERAASAFNFIKDTL